jgi:hypothetical protein
MEKQMSEEPEIEVEIEQDAPVVEAKKDGSEDAIAAAIREQAKEYEVKLVAEREEKEAARRRADTAEREARVATARVADSDLDSVTNAISMVEMQREKVKRQLKDAMEAGDFDGTVKAQEDLSEAITKLNALKEGKNYIEQRKSEPVNVDPQEAYIGKFTQRSQEYLRQHRELVTNENKNKRMIAAHYEAEAEGHKPDSEAYFQFLDNKLGYADAPKKAPSRMPAGAPVSRGNGDIQSGGNGNVIKLSSGEARAATDGSIVWNAGANKGEPIGVKEYARRKSLMIKNGQYADAMQ